MAFIRKADSIRSIRETGPGWRNTISRIMAGPAQGCNEITVRYLTIRPDGKTPREEFDFLRVVTVIQGRLLFMDGDGAVNAVGEGDVIIVRPYERHDFRNDSQGLARLHISEVRVQDV